MAEENDKMKLMVCTFKKDGSMGFVYDTDIQNEPFIGIVQDSINDLADEWFEFVEVSKKTKKKIKPFRLVVRI